jgi:hypothetical protein
MDGRPISAIIQNSYSPDGNIIKSAVQGGFTSFFHYQGDTTTVTVLNGNLFNERLVITRNAAGLTSNLRTELDDAGLYWYNDAYVYNGIELATDKRTSSVWDSTAVRTFTWSGGNMVAMTVNGKATYHFDYYLDKLRQAGDHFALDSLLNGYEIYHTRNLVKTAFDVVFDYSFDANGRVDAIRATLENTSNTVKLTYQCN